MISKYYKIVYFTQDPYLADRIPVAALLQTGPEVKAIRPTTVPGAVDSRAVFLLNSVLPAADDHNDFAHLPFSLGPHFELSEHAHPIPSHVGDPEKWLTSILSPSSSRSPRPRSRAETRGTEGRRFLRMQGVDEYVFNTFRTEKAQHRFAPEASGPLEPITHYVLSTEGLLLMEPIVARGFKDEIRKINTRFGAYRQALAPNAACQMIGYVLPGVPDKVKAQSREFLAQSSHHVIDADSGPQCCWFRNEIRRVAAAPPLN